MTSVDSLTASFYDNKQYSDITIKFGEHQIRAHKVILAQQSGYFMTAFSSRFQIASNPVIDLGDEDDPEILTDVIKYCYCCGPIHDQVPDFCGSAKCSIPLDRLTDIYVLTDKYDIHRLRCKVDRAFHDSADEDLKQSYTKAASNSTFVDCIVRICGPSSPQLADTTLQNTIVYLCKIYCPALFGSEKFLQRYSKGELFDTEQATALGLELSISVLSARGVSHREADEFSKCRKFGSRSSDVEERNMHNFFDDQRFSDIAVTYGDGHRKILVHRIVLAIQSCYFNEVLKNNPNLTEIYLGDGDNYSSVATAFLGVMYMPFESPSNGPDWPLYFAELYMLAKKHGRDDAEADFESYWHDAMSDTLFDDEYLTYVAAFCGPDSSRYAGTDIAEMAFKHILYRVENAEERTVPPCKSFEERLADGTLFNASFTRRFATRMVACFMETQNFTN